MRIAAYCRVSTDHDEQLDSLEHQKEFFTEYAQKNGHQLIRLYADEGISGTSLKKRDEFKRLMQDAELDLFDMVVAKDISRFARNTVDFLQSIRKLKSLGINTLFLTANMDSLGESEFVLTMFSAMAQEESANLSKRVKFGKKINAQKGRVPQRIYGYDRIDNFTLAINEREAEVVREIFRLYVEEGLGCRRISIFLNKHRIPTKFGCEWNTTGVRRVIANPIYCGKYENNKYEIQDYLTKKQVPIPVEKHFHHDRPEWAIISEDTFEQARRQLIARRKQYDSGPPFKQARYSSKHVFSTLIKCGYCGRSFVQKHYTYVNTRVYWKCPTNDQYTAEHCPNTVKINEDDLLNQLGDYFASMIQDRTRFMQDIISAVQQQSASKSSPDGGEALEAKRKKLLTKKTKYQEMYANDIITMTELKAQTKDINADLSVIEKQLCLAQSSPDRANAKAAAAQYLTGIEEFLSLKSVTNQEMRKVIDHITVHSSGTTEIHLKKIEQDNMPC